MTVHELKVEHYRRVPQLSYLRWILQAQSKLAELHSANAFDLVHHVTYATDWLPAPYIKGVPLIWGPVGGSTGLPKSLSGHFTRKLRTKEAIRAAITSGVRFLTAQWATRNVSILVAQNHDTAANYAKLRKIYLRPNYIVNAGLDGNCDRPRHERKAAVVGRLIEMKGVHIAVAAMATDELRSWQLDIIGDGPMRGKLEQAAIELGVSDRVVFHGQIPREDVYAHLRTATCSLLLSTHDAAGWSAAESIAVGTPVHTWQHGGPAELVRLTGCGTTTMPGPSAIASLASAIAGTDVPSEPANMTRFDFESLTHDLRNWYDEATR